MSTLRTNALEGVDAKNSITIVAGAGNITTTNVQEGLAKVWCQFDGTASTPSFADSFNGSGITDNGTGDFTVSFTNDMGNGNYATSIDCTYFAFIQQPSTTVAGSCRFGTSTEDATRQDRTGTCYINFGDLA
jgi:hypothetical protein